MLCDLLTHLLCDGMLGSLAFCIPFGFATGVASGAAMETAPTLAICVSGFHGLK